MTFNQIADWLNERGYKTLRKHAFKGTHVFSILKKRRLREMRINRPYEVTLDEWYKKDADCCS